MKNPIRAPRRSCNSKKNIDYKNYHAPDHLFSPAIWFVITAFIAAVCLVSWIDNVERDRIKQSIIDRDQHIQQLERIIQNKVSGHENS